MSVQFMHGSAIAMFVIKLSQAGILRTTILIGRLIELHIKNLSRQISFPANVTPLNQGRIKGGGALWASTRGPALSGGPADFLGLAVVYGAMFFGTAPHGFGRTVYVSGRWGPTF